MKNLLLVSICLLSSMAFAIGETAEAVAIKEETPTEVMVKESAVMPDKQGPVVATEEVDVTRKPEASALNIGKIIEGILPF